MNKNILQKLSRMLRNQLKFQLISVASPPAVPGSGRIGIRSVNMAKGASHFTNSSPLHKNSSSHQHFHSQPHHHHHLDHHQTIKSSGVQSRLERNRQMAAETITAENWECVSWSLIGTFSSIFFWSFFLNYGFAFLFSFSFNL